MRSESSPHGLDEFLAEVQSLTKVHHRNLVSSIGYCWEKDHLALFGMLIQYLFDKFPNWQKIGSPAIGDLQGDIICPLMEGTVPMPAQWCTSSRPKRVWLLHIQPFSLYFPAAIYVFDCSKLKDQRNRGKGRVPLLPAVVLTMVKAVGLPSKV
ncbi:unnamed protein product [Miscanthus lutarioriparius]|uniref:Serine-threonine/tyrosine-protein kinase catalytic domain-containing protein n=1 Tax=Miscanthus lutarioriparius TaxID=422564 RepID=A0A811MZW6_9POAL|nr:unnamed protein product [Miscanthus lutarioriparius]